MSRRKRQKAKLPIVDNHWILLGLGLWTGIPSAILIPMAYGTDAFGIGLAAGTFTACIGVGYLIRAIAHRLID